jgi:hypothetical protein
VKLYLVTSTRRVTAFVLAESRNEASDSVEEMEHDACDGPEIEVDEVVVREGRTIFHRAPQPGELVYGVDDADITVLDAWRAVQEEAAETARDASLLPATQLDLEQHIDEKAKGQS